MNEKNTREKLEQDLLVLANKYAASRIKISTYNFDLDYQRKDDGELYLMSEKAVIRVMGKTTKVPIGVNEKFSTYEDAFEATKKYWQEYYKKVRLARAEIDKPLKHRRDKRYRDKIKNEEQDFQKRTK